MPLHSNSQETPRSERIVQSGRTAATIVKDIADATKSSSLKGLAGVGLMIFEMFSNVKSNKEKCLIMTEQVYELMCAIINCCEDATMEIAPAFLNSVSVLTLTFHKVLSFMQEHTGGNLLKQWLHHHQIATLMKECMSSLQHALSLFRVQSGVMTMSRMMEMQSTAIKRHTEILDIIYQTSDVHNQLKQSSSSISVLLPSVPKIIHGREHELAQILNTLSEPDTARVAILGPGGIGKTSLAQAILHHPIIVAKHCTHRYWISCDSSKSIKDLIGIISTHFGVDTQVSVILQRLQAITGPVLLILDNFETPWEQPSMQVEVEKFLSHLTGLENLSLIITMRGAERPGQVQWTRPCLPPLGPISQRAARQTFLEISDVDPADPELDQLLSLTNNVPLVVSLMENVTEAESCAVTLARWRSESTSLLSQGADKRNNLEKSIDLSLRSPRFKDVPHAQELLSILAHLPDGLTPSEFDQTELHISELSYCRSILCRTSLAYITHDNRLKLLTPTRDCWTIWSFPRM
ncbi:P-loop containing nucleoside triphosphate hydrolase protein [Mycena floridula]|nr:P-loop containing nucleoside triphosphate hydrolase protein [Mycena floridula]